MFFSRILLIFCYFVISRHLQVFFCATKEPKAPGVRYLPDPEPLGARPKTPCRQSFSVLQILLQTNAARVIFILIVICSHLPQRCIRRCYILICILQFFGEILKIAGKKRVVSNRPYGANKEYCKEYKMLTGAKSSGGAEPTPTGRIYNIANTHNC